MKNITDKQALQEWDDFLVALKNSTPIDLSESPEQKAKRIKKLEADPEEWFKYYFPKYCFCEPAAFHKKSTKKVLGANRLYQRRAWARGLSKSTRRMFEIFYKMFVQKFPVNMLLLSKSADNAQRLLDPYQANLEANNRIINDYGVQERPGKWERGEFITRNNCAFRAVGAGQSPRGTRNEALRVTVITADDLDDDEVCRNPERLQQQWDWFEQAVIPTVDISGDYLICIDNNIIAEDSIAVRAAAYANDVELVNIRDENGLSSWPEKNSEDDIRDIENTVSYESFQKEYFNNPMNQGKTFKEMTWGACPPLKMLSLMVVYGDPSPSNKDKPTMKSKAQNSAKCVVMIGYKEGKFYIYNCFLENTTNSIFIDWFYKFRNEIANKISTFFYVENNGLQNPFYEQLLLPLIYEKGKAEHENNILSITPDDRDKPEKWTRIEATLEALNRLGLLIFNSAEKENPHMLRLEAQFKAASATSKKLDGPDAVEGAVHKLKEKVSVQAVGNIKTFKRPLNYKRF